MNVILRAPLDLLKDHQDDLVMLLRLGAGSNAIESSARLILKVGPETSEVDKLSRMLCVCSGLASFRELVTMIQKEKYLDRLIELATRGLPFTPVPVSLDRARELLSPSHPDIGGNDLLRIRDKMTFHWDPHPFRDLLASAKDGVINLWALSGEPPDRIFATSAYAIAQAVLSGTNLTADEFMRLFLEAVAIVGHVLESAFMGLLIEAGATDPRAYLIRGEDEV